MIVLLVIISPFFLLVFGILRSASRQEKEKEIAIEKLEGEEGFQVNHRYDGKKKQMMVVDEEAGRFAFLNGTEECRVHSVNEIIDKEIKIYDDFSTKNSTGVSATGALLGGAVGGGVGAAVGGVRRKSQIVNEVERVVLHIVVRDTQDPTINFDVLYTRDSRDSKDVKKALEEAEELTSILSILMERHDSN